MSYDVYLRADWCEHCQRGDEVFSWNYTSNMASAWRHADADLAEFEGKRARDCAPILAAAIADMEARPEDYVRFNSSNGWGSMATLLPALRELLRAMAANPNTMVEVSR